ncbi:MAG: BON domain-containing protein [Steroidobacteraceae bacterium]
MGRAICFGQRMDRGYSRSAGRFGGRSYGGYGTTGDYGYGIHRSDAQLYEHICEALLRRDDVDCSDVSIAVHEGEVTLDSSVPRRFMRYLIEDLAAGHPAVRDVDNRISVRKS